MTDQNQLTEIVAQSNLPEPKVATLMATFAPAFQEAKAIVAQAKNITVTDENDIAGMQAARESRLKLKDIRVSIEKTRKELKDQSLREGRAIDGAANIIKALVMPVEEHLQQQEKYAELLEEKRLNERYQKRLNELAPYVEDTSLYKLKEMSDAAFENLLVDCKAAHEARIAAEKKAEAERLENERKQKVFTNRRIELAPYQDFVVSDFELTVDTSEDVFKSVLEKAQLAKKTHQAEQQKIAEQAEKDRKAREEAEEKLRKQKAEQEQKELAERAKLEAEQKAKEEAERKAMLAPDKEKMLKFASDLEAWFELPAIKSAQAQKAFDQAASMIAGAVEHLRAEAKKL